MEQIARYRQLDVQCIELADNSYNLAPFASAQCSGSSAADSLDPLLHPPLVLERNNRIIPVAGLQFIEAAVKSGQEQLTGLVIDGDRIEGEEDIFILLLRYRSLHAPLTLMEQAVCLNRLRQFLSPDQLTDLLPLLGYRKKKHLLDELEALNGLHSEVQQDIHQGLIGLRAAARIGKLPPAGQEDVALLIREFQMGGSKQQQLIQRINELTRRHECGCRELLDQWRELDRDNRLNGPQRAASLLNWLDERCSPQYRAAEKEFAQFTKQLHLPGNVRLEHEPSFESDRVTLCIDFKDREQLTGQWPLLRPYCTS